MKTKKHVRPVSVLGSVMLLVFSQLPAAEHGTSHWTYEGAEGPEHWGTLSEAYRMCSEGSNQSPIDLVADVDASLPELEFEYYSNFVDVINNGHTIQQNIQPGSFLKIGKSGEVYQLKQLHFHSPAEHTINGKSFAMEVHFVHMNEQGALAVVGVMIEQGQAQPVLNQLWAFMPEHAGDSIQQPVGIETTDLLPATREYFAYNGSLTTPPCSEGVKWMVLKTPIEASMEQISLFKSRVGEANNRPVQPHNARLILD